MNVTGTLNVLVAARDAGDVRVVYASSAAVYGNADELPLHEGMPTRPASPYGASKLAGERYLEAFTRTYGTPTVALRYLNVFGPRQNPHSEYAAAIPRFISCTLTGEVPVVFGDGEQARDFVFVDDVVQANLLASDAGEPAWGAAFNIGRGERRTVNELVDTVRSRSRRLSRARARAAAPGRGAGQLERYRRGGRGARLRAGGRVRGGLTSHDRLDRARDHEPPSCGNVG